jgi:hypothetical protein
MEREARGEYGTGGKGQVWKGRQGANMEREARGVQGARRAGVKRVLRHSIAVRSPLSVSRILHGSREGRRQGEAAGRQGTAGVRVVGWMCKVPLASVSFEKNAGLES